MTGSSSLAAFAKRAALALLMLAPMGPACAGEGEIVYSISTKIYVGADGSVNLPRYSGYRLTHEKDGRSVTIIGTFYPSGTQALSGRAAESLALRVWEASQDFTPPKLLALCCAPGLGPDNVRVVKSGPALRILEFLTPAGQPLYREIRQRQQPSMTLTLGLSGQASGQQLRAIAVSSDQPVNKRKLRAFLCGMRDKEALASPDVSHLQDVLGADHKALKIVRKPC